MGFYRYESLGAGTQSTCMALMSAEGWLPKLDGAVFADTGWEPPEVYEHLDALTQYLDTAGIPVHRASRGALADDVLDPHVYATIPAWTLEPVQVAVAWRLCTTCRGEWDPPDDIDGKDVCPECHDNSGSIPTRWAEQLRKGRIIRQCTPKYKVEPLEQRIRELVGAPVWTEWCSYCSGAGFRVAPWDTKAGNGPCSVCRGSGERNRIGSVPEGTTVEQWIGFSTDEFERCTTTGFPSWSTPRWPLIELGMTRKDCIAWMAERGWKGIAKSACVGCPFHDDETWLRMADQEPDRFAELVAYDRKLRTAPGLRAKRFLHEARLPLDEAVERYRRLKEESGEQGVLWEEYKARRKVRRCNPFGCGSEEVDEEGAA